MRGDINGDNKVSIADAVLLSRLASEDDSVSVDADTLLDLNSDGVLNIQDVIQVLHGCRSTSLTLSNIAGTAGDTISIPVQIYNDRGTAGGQLKVAYDPMLTPKTIRGGSLKEIALDTDVNGYPVYVAWITLDGRNQTAADGAVIAYLDFEISEYAGYGSALNVNVTEAELSDENGIITEPAVKNAYVFVTE